MAWDEMWETWRQDNAAELKHLRILLIKMKREQLNEVSADKTRVDGGGSSPVPA